jgi:hypothetical protein
MNAPGVVPRDLRGKQGPERQVEREGWS